VTRVHINEVESSGGDPGDRVELYNPGATAADVSGFIFRDNDDTHTYLVPAGTLIAPGGFHVLEEAAVGFGLGAADSARIFDPAGTLLDSFTWAAHATTTYGRCPDGTGALVATTSATKGAVNACPGAAQPWPGDGTVQAVDGVSVFGGNMSGLVHEGSGTPAPGALWAVRNGPGTLFRLIWDDVNAMWIPDPASGGSAGKALRYPDGTGNPDAEGVTFAGTGSGGGVYVSTERNNDANGVSRNSILRFAPASASSVLTATNGISLPISRRSVRMSGWKRLPGSRKRSWCRSGSSMRPADRPIRMTRQTIRTTATVCSSLDSKPTAPSMPTRSTT
jgi:hypothetical protein